MTPPAGRPGERAPASESWWPSPFGAEDQLGMLNHISEAKRLQAIALVRAGRIYDLAHVLDESVPVFPGRYFRQTLVTTAHHSNAGSSDAAPSGLGECNVNWITETISGTMQLGTHLDALSHLQMGERGYNGWSVSELAETWGVNRLGAETIPQIVTRGWLVDVLAARGVDHLGAGEVVSVNDVQRALDGVAPEPGDAVLFHTGWGARWEQPDEYLAGGAWTGAGAGGMASRPRCGTDRLRYLELWPCPGRGSHRTVPSAPASERSPRCVHRREPRHGRTGGGRRAGVRADPHPPQTPRRLRRVDCTDSPRLRRSTDR